MSALYPCPGCGQNRKADEGHASCRQCEGYAVVLREDTALLRDEVDDLRGENERLRAERDALRVRVAELEGGLAIWGDFAMEASSMYESTLRYQIRRCSEKARAALSVPASEKQP